MRLLSTSYLLVLCHSGLAQTTPPAALPPGAAVPTASQATNRSEPPPRGMPFVHDPSTVIQYRGKYYVYTTGKGIPMLSSPDEVHWARLGSVFQNIPDRVHDAVPKNNGKDVWAPDIVRLGNTFYLYYAVSSWGSFRSVVALATNTTLDPTDPVYRWVDQGLIVGSDGEEDLNAIDPGVVLAPDGTMWLCYGSYHGSIRILQLDPRTGLALAGGNAGAVAIARQSEASDIIFHTGYFYLFVNHGSCCQGAKSEYNIRVGRSKSVTGPYLDKHGMALTAGGGSLFLAAHDHRIGPGHFGRVIMDGDGNQQANNSAAAGPDIEQFSLHYEADKQNLGRPTLGIRPLLWSTDGWPVAGDTLAAGTYQIISVATEDSLLTGPPISDAPASLHLGRYIAIDKQQWSIEPAEDGFYKIANAGNKAILSAVPAADNTLELTSTSNGTGAQLWKLDQFTDGSYRICNKAANKCLTRKLDGTVELMSVTGNEDGRWLITSP